MEEIIKNAVLYGMGYVCGKHNLDIEKQEREERASGFAKAHVAEINSYAARFAEWKDSLPVTSLVTVHPPAGSGGSNGIYKLSYEELLSIFNNKQNKTP